MGAVGGGAVNFVKAAYNSGTNSGLRGVEAVHELTKLQNWR